MGRTLVGLLVLVGMLFYCGAESRRIRRHLQATDAEPATNVSLEPGVEPATNVSLPPIP